MWHLLDTSRDGLSASPQPWPCSCMASAQPREARGAKALQPQQSLTQPRAAQHSPEPHGLRSPSACGTKVEPQSGEGQGTGTGLCLAHLRCHITSSAARTCLGACASTGGRVRRRKGGAQPGCGHEYQNIINCLGWKSPLRSSSAAPPALPRPPPAHSLKCHIHVVSKFHQGWGLHHHLEQLC